MTRRELHIEALRQQLEELRRYNPALVAEAENTLNALAAMDASAGRPDEFAGLTPWKAIERYLLRVGSASKDEIKRAVIAGGLTSDAKLDIEHRLGHTFSFHIKRKALIEKTGVLTLNPSESKE
jgi:hypothetical protein